jgi:general secretion pathway protein D
LAGLLAACASGLESSNLLEDKLARLPPASGTAAKRARLEKFLATHAAGKQGQFDGFVRYGDNRLIGQPISSGVQFDGDEAQDLKLNLVGVPVAEAAKSILGDVMALNYSVDARVTGTVTLQTSKPVTRRRLLAMFEGALRDNGAALVSNGETYRIVPLAEATRTLATMGKGDSEPIGVRPYVVQLRFVAAEEMAQILDPIVPQGMIVKADARRNVLILSGTAEEIASVRETISVFDVDWMRGMSFALIPVKSSSPDAITNDLEQIFETKKGGLKNVLRFVPNKRLKSVLVISSRAKYLKEATSWIRKLDVLAENSEQSLHVYHVQNRTAAELAKVLQSVLRSEMAVKTAAAAQVAPKLGAAETGVTPIPNEPTSGPETPATGPGSNAAYETELAESEPAALEATGAGDGRSPVRVVADDANNSLLIFATTIEYERIAEVLAEIDSVPNQVLLEAVIAEVSLDDDMQFGVRWLFGETNNHGTFSDLSSGLVASAFPGFSYFLKANDVSFTLNALSSVTDVRVLSAPSLVVLDNRAAKLQVGDQVPIVSQTAENPDNPDARIINSVELKDTGVILTVTPRVNDSGRVVLEIEQEVSDVVKTDTSDIDSPTIRQRKIKTSVVINDGEALALGGLIQERESTGKTKVPVLGDVPILGNAFRRKSNAIKRTELIIFIRPRVIRNFDEARRITREFREQLGVKAPRVRRDEPTPGGELIRILN